MNTRKPVVLVTENMFKRGYNVFQSITDLELIIVSESESLIANVAREKNPIAVILGVEKYSSELYRTLNRGSLIVRFGVGYDGIDLEKASAKGLIVTNTPGVLESTVAEFTLLLAGEVMRSPGLSSHQMKNGSWNFQMGSEFSGKTWAILGLGKIGKQLSRILTFGFGMKVFAFDLINYNPDILKNEYGVEKVSSEFSQIVSHADIVSLHLPANRDTHHFMNRERLKLLKPGAILINTGRGALIDENALYDAIETGHLVGAGLDVFENEPYFPVDFNKDLRNLPNVVLTPHIASSTIECSKRMAEKTIQNIRYALNQKFELMDIINKI